MWGTFTESPFSRTQSRALIFVSFPFAIPILTCFPCIFLSFPLMKMPIIKFGIASRIATKSVPKTTIPTSIAAMLIARIASPSRSRTKNMVPIAMSISTNSAIPFDSGGSPAAFSIASSSVSWNTLLVIFPASLAIMNPTSSITIIDRNSPRYFTVSSSQSILNICCV